MDDLDRRILAIIQTDLPVVERPFDILADRLDADGGDVLERIGRLCADGLIRRLGPVFDSGRLGYCSTLVAARVPEGRLDEVAGIISELPGVTHNYRRDHSYNLWFTLTVRNAGEIADIVSELRQRTGVEELYTLPALAVFKRRVVFRLVDDASRQPARAERAGPAVCLTDEQKRLVRLVQDGLPITSEPFAEMAASLGWTVTRVLGQLQDWTEAGIIRRFGAVLNHRTLGFVANGMVVFRAPPGRVDEMGRKLAACPEVTHCFRRPPLPDWDCSLFAMVHGRCRDEVRRFVAGVAQELRAPHYDILFSTAEYKKTSMRYFVEG